MGFGDNCFGLLKQPAHVLLALFFTIGLIFIHDSTTAGDVAKQGIYTTGAMFVHTPEQAAVLVEAIKASVETSRRREVCC
jgi:hypothetical protein